MPEFLGPWLPDQSLYLAKQSDPYALRERPWCQGDIFKDVALPVLGKPKQPDTPPKDIVKFKTGHVILLGHPCSLRGGGQVAMFQNVVQVREAKDTEIDRFAEVAKDDRPWERYYQLFPLPDLIDGKLYVADFNLRGTVFFKHLLDHRIACLTKEGWAAFQKRYAWHALRIHTTIEDRVSDLRALWSEMEIWQEWCVRGFPEPEFQEWASLPLGGDSQYQETVRRDLFEMAPDAVKADLPESGAEWREI